MLLGPMTSFQINTSAVMEASTLLIAGLFPIVNPIGSAAVFQALVDHFDLTVQRQLAKKIAFCSFFLLFFSIICGGKILSFFGVSLYSVQVGGGLVVAVNSWLLLSRTEDADSAPAPSTEAILMQAFYPLTLPFTVGPGAISVAVALGAHLPSELKASTFSALTLVVAAFGAFVICICVYVCYRWANPAEHLLGTTGTAVVMRLSAFISLCIGVQVVASGMRTYLGTVH
jgi:multiple antibiotic resistance protein